MDFQSYFPVWNKLTPAQQERILGSLMERRVSKGTVIHNGSMDCTGLLLAKSGQLRAYILSDEGREITIYRLFDRDMCQSAIRRGARHAFHLPLAINTARLKEQLGISSEGGLLRPDTYMHDISFVGSLYESSHYSSFRYAAIWQASLLPRRKCGESTSSRRFLLPDGSRNSSLSCPIPRRNMKC